MGKYRWSMTQWVERKHARVGYTYLVTRMDTKNVYCFRSTSRIKNENEEIHMLPNWGYPKAYALNYLLQCIRDYCNNTPDSYPVYYEVEEIIADWAKDAVWRRIE